MSDNNPRGNSVPTSATLTSKSLRDRQNSLVDTISDNNSHDNPMSPPATSTSRSVLIDEPQDNQGSDRFLLIGSILIDLSDGSITIVNEEANARKQPTEATDTRILRSNGSLKDFEDEKMIRSKIANCYRQMKDLTNVSEEGYSNGDSSDSWKTAHYMMDEISKMIMKLQGNKGKRLETEGTTEKHQEFVHEEDRKIKSQCTQIWEACVPAADCSAVASTSFLPPMTEEHERFMLRSRPVPVALPPLAAQQFAQTQLQQLGAANPPPQQFVQMSPYTLHPLAVQQFARQSAQTQLQQQWAANPPQQQLETEGTTEKHQELVQDEDRKTECQRPQILEASVPAADRSAVASTSFLPPLTEEHERFVLRSQLVATEVLNNSQPVLALPPLAAQQVAGQFAQTQLQQQWAANSPQQQLPQMSPYTLHPLEAQQVAGQFAQTQLQQQWAANPPQQQLLQLSLPTLLPLSAQQVAGQPAQTQLQQQWPANSPQQQLLVMSPNTQLPLSAQQVAGQSAQTQLQQQWAAANSPQQQVFQPTYYSYYDDVSYPELDSEFLPEEQSMGDVFPELEQGVANLPHQVALPAAGWRQMRPPRLSPRFVPPRMQPNQGRQNQRE